MFSYHGGEQGKRSWMRTAVRHMYPKLLAKTGNVPGGPKRNKIPEQTIGEPKWIIPYGSQAKTSRRADVCFDRILDKLAPYRMDSTAGNNLTDISGRHAAGMKDAE
jgi:hypothetical protein